MECVAIAAVHRSHAVYGKAAYGYAAFADPAALSG